MKVTDEAIKGAKDCVSKNLLEDILNVSSSFKKKLKFSVVSRKLNRTAYCLAKFGFMKDFFFKIFYLSGLGLFSVD